MGGRTLSGGLENAYVLLKFCVKVAERLGRKKEEKEELDKSSQRIVAYVRKSQEKRENSGGEKALKLKM